jgi:hypothetical protein
LKRIKDRIEVKELFVQLNYRDRLCFGTDGPFIKIVSEDSLLYRWEMNDINICKSLLKVPGYGAIRTGVLFGRR